MKMISILLSIICIVNINGLQLNENHQSDINNKTLTDVEGFVFDSSKFPRNYRPKTFRKLDLPTFYDLRMEWPECDSIWMIWDQGRCGSCWAFGTVMAMSDRLCIQSYGEIKAILSTQNVLTCCENCGFGCWGGYPDMAYEYWNKEGIVTGGSYQSNDGCQPYTFGPCTPDHNPCHEEENRPEVDPPCQRFCTDVHPISYENDKYFGTEWFDIESESEIMYEIYAFGTVSAMIEVFEDFENYEGGIYERKSDVKKFWHVVRLIGWGEENGTKYWIGANSWNDFWGENGFFRIRRGSNEAGIEGRVMAADPDFDRSK